MRLKFNVHAQQIFRVDRSPLASDSRRYIAATAEFDSEWDDLTARWLTFEPRTGTAITAVLADGSSFEESLGVSLSAGTWRVSAHGSNSAGKEIHTTSVLLNVAQAGGHDGEAPPYVPPDAAGQIAAVAEEARETANQAKELAKQSGVNAEAAAKSAEAASDAADIAIQNANSSAADAKSAREFKISALEAADRAEQAILTNGYAEFHIENGRLMLSRTSNISEKLDFQLTKGRLEAIING